ASPRRGGRIVTAATVAWEAAYPVAYAHGYATLAHWAAEHFHDMHDRLTLAQPAQRQAAEAVRRLIDAAESAVPRRVTAAQPPRRVHEIGALAALDRLDGRTAPEAIAHEVHQYAVRVAGMHGALTAAADINIAWRSHIDPTDLSIPVDGVTLVE